MCFEYIQEFNVLSLSLSLQSDSADFTISFGKVRKRTISFRSIALHRVYLMCLWRKSARYKSLLHHRYVIKIASRNFSVFAFFFFSAEFQVHYATDFYLLDNIMLVWQHSFSETRFIAFLCLRHRRM